MVIERQKGDERSLSGLVTEGRGGGGNATRRGKGGSPAWGAPRGSRAKRNECRVGVTSALVGQPHPNQTLTPQLRYEGGRTGGRVGGPHGHIENPVFVFNVNSLSLSLLRCQKTPFPVRLTYPLLRSERVFNSVGYFVGLPYPLDLTLLYSYSSLSLLCFGLLRHEIRVLSFHVPF